MTIGELLLVYEQNHVINLKDRLGTSRRLQRYIVPYFAALQLGDLTRIQVVTWYQEIGHTRGFTAATQALQQLRALYARAQDWDLYEGKNPADRVKKFPKRSRERFVQSHEMPYLLRALSDAMPKVETFFLCLLLTGARRDEARLMKWADLDLDRALWMKPKTKTTPHPVPLPAQLVSRLRTLPRVNEWVFPSNPNPRNGMCARQWSVTACEHAWCVVRQRAGLNDVRIHDLRRTAASMLAINGENLFVIQRMLNHVSLASTQVYARLSVEPVRQALNDQAERILGPVPAPAGPHPARLPQHTSEAGEEWPG